MATLFELKEEIEREKKIRISTWDKDEYIVYNPIRHKFVTENGEDYSIEINFLFSDEWEIYKKIIEYGKCLNCLCKFWNKKDSYVYGILTGRKGDKFIDQCNVMYNHCEPAKYCDVEFYCED